MADAMIAASLTTAFKAEGLTLPDRTAMMSIVGLSLLEAMKALARAYPPRHLEQQAYALYEDFRPSVPEGEKGWGAKGQLDLTHIRSLADRAKK